jgi:hypothetical protein
MADNDANPTSAQIRHGFGSAHAGTIVAAVGDGSVAALSLETDINVLNLLGKRSDGSVATLDDAR